MTVVVRPGAVIPRRCLQVALLRATGTPIKAIGDRFGITFKTVEYHYHAFCEKELGGNTDPVIVLLWAIANRYVTVKAILREHRPQISVIVNRL